MSSIVLEQRDDADRVQATLLEFNHDIAQAACHRAAAAGLAGIEVRTVDAGKAASYVGVVPADLVLMVGIFGNITDEDIHATIRAVPQFCRSGATMVWSRGREDRDLGEQILGWFREAACENVAYTTWPDSSASVGAVRFVGTSEPLDPNRHLFTFLR